MNCKTRSGRFEKYCKNLVIEFRILSAVHENQYFCNSISLNFTINNVSFCNAEGEPDNGALG